MFTRPIPHQLEENTSSSVFEVNYGCVNQCTSSTHTATHTHTAKVSSLFAHEAFVKCIGIGHTTFGFNLVSDRNENQWHQITRSSWKTPLTVSVRIYHPSAPGCFEVLTACLVRWCTRLNKPNHQLQKRHHIFFSLCLFARWEVELPAIDPQRVHH